MSYCRLKLLKTHGKFRGQKCPPNELEDTINFGHHFCRGSFHWRTLLRKMLAWRPVGGCTQERLCLCIFGKVMKLLRIAALTNNAIVGHSLFLFSNDML